MLNGAYIKGEAPQNFMTSTTWEAPCSRKWLDYIIYSLQLDHEATNLQHCARTAHVAGFHHTSPQISDFVAMEGQALGPRDGTNGTRLAPRNVRRPVGSLYQSPPLHSRIIYLPRLHPPSNVSLDSLRNDQQTNW
ncbi:hypothetical protein PAXRUDRAFT_228414 [Paxillus rubicundulus Ve08.2h10]|uniref:Uncharacterized protein n=1 Tax=Paxillus rubicundulus Ve08.2h10 TaxID=930991 RepID=A0A0D0E728_9AGAM|nr:hypothetical protein PAXRUDRAFT_228414 [Paxillus rubicundulus Ve08.2h10]